MTKQESYVPKEQATAEEQEMAKTLELDTDNIYRLRVQIYSLRDRFKDCLPMVNDESGMHKAHWKDLVSWKADNSLDSHLNFDHLIKKYEQDSDDFILAKDEVLAAIDESLVLYEELKSIGGDKPINSRDLYDLDKPGEMAPAYYGFRMKELRKAENSISDLELKMEQNRRLYNKAAESHVLKDPGAARRRYNEDYQKLFDTYQELIRSSPEAFLSVAYEQIREAKETFDSNGTIVETPYVKEKIVRIVEQLRTHRPVFIHGELGSGKTEIAKHIIRTRLQNSNEILEIRGMRSLEKEDILSRTVIEREKIPEAGELIGLEKKAWEKWEQENSEAYKADNRLRDYHKALFAEKYRSAIKTSEVLSPIFRAMKEGRPVLIDEMNAIPHHVLIVLNDIINKRPGELVYTPSGGTITVKDGFCVISTGNWKPEDGKLYVGRSPIDAAFLSRFGLDDYDFLPNSKTFEDASGDPEAVAKQRQGNELFRMLMVRLIDSGLGANIPEGAVNQIKRLAVCARIFQDVFSEKGGPMFNKGGEQNPKDILQENVLSLRHLVPVIEHWKKDGYTRPLDEYIFLDYINRSKARPNEMQYIYQVLQTIGRFFDKDDEFWPDSMDSTDINRVSDSGQVNIIKRMYGVDSLTGKEEPIKPNGIKLKYIGPKEVIEELFGTIPERINYPEGILRSDIIQQSEDDELAQAERDLRLKRISGLASSIKGSFHNKKVRDKKVEKGIKSIVST